MTEQKDKNTELNQQQDLVKLEPCYKDQTYSLIS